MPFDQHRKFEHIWALKYRRCNKLVSCFVNSQNHGIKNNAIFVLHVTNACVLQKVCINGSAVITCRCPWYLLLAQHSSIVMPGVSSNPHPVFQSSLFWVPVTVSFFFYLLSTKGDSQWRFGLWCWLFMPCVVPRINNLSSFLETRF